MTAQSRNRARLWSAGATLRVRVGLIVDVHQLLDGCVGVLLGCGKRLVSEQFLDRAQIRAIRQQVRRECMSLGMRMQVPVDICEPHILFHNPAHTALRQPASAVVQEDGVDARPAAVLFALP